MSSKQEPLQIQAESPQQQYYFRTLICFAAAGTLGAYINWSNISYLYAVTIVGLLAYAYATYFFTHKQAPDTLAKTSRWLSYVDAGLIGLVLGFTNFSILPCVL